MANQHTECMRACLAKAGELVTQLATGALAEDGVSGHEAVDYETIRAVLSACVALAQHGARWDRIAVRAAEAAIEAAYEAE